MKAFDRHRKRRVLYNDDADQQYDHPGYEYKVVDKQSFLDMRTTPAFDTHVDTYVWCVGNGAEPPWNHSLTLWPCIESHAQANDWIVEACHARGVEVWGSLRMNDTHDSFMANSLGEAHEPIKAEHPEYLIVPQSERPEFAELAERWQWTSLDFSHDEVRAYRLDYIERNASAHDFDGYELDFTRFIWNFPLGKERELAPRMTKFIREARGRLDAVGERRGRPYTFAVHVMDSPELSLNLGQDVEAWLREGLVDVLVVGMGYLPYALRLDQWLALGKQYGVPIYPSVNTNTFQNWWKEPERRPDAWHEAVRAAYSYFWQEGADGVAVFNIFCHEAKGLGALPRDCVYAPLSEIGDPAAMAGKDKLYGIQPVAESGWCHHGSGPAQLPIALDKVERKLCLKIGPDADARLNIYFRAAGGNEDTRLWLRLNHTLLPKPTRNGDWHYTDVPAGVMRTGDNGLNIWCDEAAVSAGTPLIVHHVFARAMHGGDAQS